MKRRCTNPTRPEFSRYGERGITVCDEWLNDFKVFYDWAIASGWEYEKTDYGINRLTLDRIDTYGPYAPWNCRWATVKEQGNNTRRNHILEYGGEKYTIAQFAEYLGVPGYIIHNRLRNGWSLEKIANTPVRDHKPYEWKCKIG